jgi:hypothetical protein
MLTLLPLLHSHGAIISRDLNCDVTHVVVSSMNSLRHGMIEVRIGQSLMSPHLSAESHQRAQVPVELSSREEDRNREVGSRLYPREEIALSLHSIRPYCTARLLLCCVLTVSIPSPSLSNRLDFRPR